MFKNPLKYQQGGQLNQEQQQMLAAFIDWLPKRVKEFEGMQVVKSKILFVNMLKVVT